MRFTSIAKCLLIWFLCGAFTAFSHPLTQGTLELQSTDATLEVRVRIPMESLLVFNTRLESDSIGKLWQAHGEYLLQHLLIDLDGSRLAGKFDNNIDLDETAQVLPANLLDRSFVLYRFYYPLPQHRSELVVRQNILNDFDYSLGNRWEATFLVSLVDDGKILQEGVLLTSSDAIAMSFSSTTASQESAQHPTIAKQYFVHGVEHILTGYDHLLFVAALVLVSVTLWDLIKIVTAFTAAHTITLVLASLNVIRLSPAIVEPLIAASIVFVALQNVFFPVAARRGSRLAIAFFFGLFHGLGFAGGLLEAMAQMDSNSLTLALLSFSAGVEVGHQIVVLPLFLALRLLRTVRAGAGRNERMIPNIERIASGLIAVAGILFLYGALQH